MRNADGGIDWGFVVCMVLVFIVVGAALVLLSGVDMVELWRGMIWDG